MYDLIDIFKDISEIDAVFKIGSISQDGTTYNFTSCDSKTYWLKPCMTIEVPALTVGETATGKVDFVENNKSVQITFDVEIDTTIKDFLIPHGSFVHGTLPMAEIEINNLGFDDNCPMPVLYFQEIYTEILQTLDSSNDFIGDNLRLYFLDDYEQDNNMMTEDHYSDIINPMKNYALFFKEQLKKDIRIDTEYIEENTQRIIKRVKAGEYVRGGNVVSTFGRNLSGVEFNLSIAVKKDPTCGGC